MTSRLRPRSLGLLALMVIGIALLVDRIVLYGWATSVIRQFHRYQQATSPSRSNQSSVSISEVTEPPLWIQGVQAERVNILISLEPALARPDFVSIKGHLVELLYLPPPLAWTTRIFPFRPAGLQYRLYRPKDHYGYQISADFAVPTGPPVFKLYRVTNLEPHELPADTRLPELFP